MSLATPPPFRGHRNRHWHLARAKGRPRRHFRIEAGIRRAGGRTAQAKSSSAQGLRPCCAGAACCFGRVAIGLDRPGLRHPASCWWGECENHCDVDAARTALLRQPWSASGPFLTWLPYPGPEAAALGHGSHDVATSTEHGSTPQPCPTAFETLGIPIWRGNFTSQETIDRGAGHRDQRGAAGPSGRGRTH